MRKMSQTDWNICVCQSFYLEQHIAIVNRVTLQSIWFIFIMHLSSVINRVLNVKRYLLSINTYLIDCKNKHNKVIFEYNIMVHKEPLMLLVMIICF